MAKKTPMRMCVVCRNMMPKKELIRVVLSAEGEVVVDETGRANGRGAYVCKSSCVNELKKRKSFERALGGTTTDELFLKIQGLNADE